ncbi:MAG: glycosyltransferase [Burkholderiales bacterium]|nr:glycosyltransferase [Burkholderiales bacterium]
MKVVFIYRKQMSGTFSIEGLFANFREQLKERCEIIEYYANGPKNILKDASNLRKLNADVYHVTGDIHYITCFLPKNKTILTVHDINYYCDRLKGIKKFIYRIIYLTIPLRSVKYITTISSATKQRLQQSLFKCPDIKVISNCYNDKLFKFRAKDFNSKETNILLLGTAPNKNLLRVIDSIKDISCKLTIIGKLNENILDKLKNDNIKYENYFDLTMEEIYQYYVRCDMVVFASTSEGFGLPILEAQAVGRALVTSNIYPMRDIVGIGHVCIIDPYSVSSIKNGIEKIIGNAEFRNHVIDGGLDNVKNYAPNSIANEYYQLYEDIYLKNDVK